MSETKGQGQGQRKGEEGNSGRQQTIQPCFVKVITDADVKGEEKEHSSQCLKPPVIFF